MPCVSDEAQGISERKGGLRPVVAGGGSRNLIEMRMTVPPEHDKMMEKARAS